MATLVGMAVALVSSTRDAHAQIVNVQPLIADPDRQGASGLVSASLDLRTGNTQLVLISGSALVQYRSHGHLTFLLLRQELGSQAGDRFLNRDFEHLRHRFDLADGLQLEGFAQHDRDEFRRLASRIVIGAGVRVPFQLAERCELAVGSAYMLELERLSDGEEPDAGQATVAHRVSGYVTLAYQLDELIRLGQSVYAQPRVDLPEDLRVLSETELLVSLSPIFQLKLSASLGYDSSPPWGRRTLDTATKTSVELRF